MSTWVYDKIIQSDNAPVNVQLRLDDIQRDDTLYLETPVLLFREGMIAWLTNQIALIYLPSMAVTSSSNLTRAAALFHALSDETRLEILEKLRNGEQCVCELTDVLKAAQSRLSFHLRVLKDAGLIRDRPEGRWMYYALNEEALEDAEELIRTLKKAAKGARSANPCC